MAQDASFIRGAVAGTSFSTPWELIPLYSNWMIGWPDYGTTLKNYQKSDEMYQHLITQLGNEVYIFIYTHIDYMHLVIVLLAPVGYPTQA